MSQRRLRPSVKIDGTARTIEQDPRIVLVDMALVRYESRRDFATEIEHLWRDAQTRFIQIGRYLNLAKERLQHGEYEAMVERDLPFAPRTAYQFRMAAAAVDGGRLPAEGLPNSYTICYLLSTLNDETLEAARRENLIRPDVKRAEVIAFRARHHGDSDRSVALRRQHEKLLRERRKLDAAIAKVAAELQAADAMIEGAAEEDMTAG
jgi:hypothetical protein